MDSTRELRWSVGLFLIFLAVVPVLGSAMVYDAWLPVLVAVPINTAGAALAAVGMGSRDPDTSARRLLLAAALILLGDAALYGLRAAVT
ncbi:hypothetical protein [Actinoplanes aureus]|uniref:Uncharacterized protein n=1 Tax=Actinoplanes aureus TaxID=2792083 RepID=A0A931CIP6_9ACTN|nr:hypothetical protein [Actinoplanes aureus]MBG0568387.1 hypothetical protein [Actinoplanes aureus]